MFVVKTACARKGRTRLVVRSSRHGRQRAFWLPGVITADKRGSISLIFSSDVFDHGAKCPRALSIRTPRAPDGGAEEDRGRPPSMSQREFANQKALLAYAERNALIALLVTGFPVWNRR